MRYDPQLAAKIISTFDLKSIPINDPRWLGSTERARGAVIGKELWGVFDRPPQFKLINGGQFEYFYLLATPDGDMFLFAEYAYG